MMFGQDVSAMIEARNAREWEELNEEPELLPVSDVEKHLGEAFRLLNESYDRIAKAADYAKDFPLEAKLDSILHDLENLTNDIEKYRREVKAS